MTIDEARNYLYSSGMSDEQMQTVQRGFICGVLQEIRQEIEDIDEVALFKETILEILDKHIKEIEGSDKE